MTRVVRVLPDVPAIDRTFDYAVPEKLAPLVRIGSMVRVVLHGRRVGGWVVELDVEPPAGVRLQPIARLSGLGPSQDLLDLSAWAAWRWAGSRVGFLRTASPPTRVAALPPPAAPAALSWEPDAGEARAGEAFDRPRTVYRLPPGAPWWPLAMAAASQRTALILAPTVSMADEVASSLRAADVRVAVAPKQWARAAAGADVVVGSRAAAWAPVPKLARVLVLDGHSEMYQEERSPTWDAWRVAAERARRAGAPCVIASPAPTLDLLAWGAESLPTRSEERRGWAALEIVDQRREDPRRGLYSERLLKLLRDADRTLCVLNRIGRASLLACRACGELARCAPCGSAVSKTDVDLECRRCHSRRAAICDACGSTQLRAVRVGVTRVREELAAATGQDVAEVTATTSDRPDARIVVGTEAVLHRYDRADAVAFLDFDQELLAPRFRAAEDGLALLATAARLVGGRGQGRVLVQTRVPHHEVLDAALHADPSRLAEAERPRREALGLPPASAMALVSGPAAPAYIDGLTGLEVLGPDHDRWLVRAIDHPTLCDALQAGPRPSGRLRIAVDPRRV